MTPAQPTALVEVTQSDLDTAADYAKTHWLWPAPSVTDLRRGGPGWDDYHLVQAFARHRLAALEEAARVAEGWPVEACGDQYQTCGNGSFWDEGTPYDQGRADAAAAIRATAIRKAKDLSYE